VQDIRARNADTDPDEVQRIVDEAVSEVPPGKPAVIIDAWRDGKFTLLKWKRRLKMPRCIFARV
jgi:hypothetical protein